jgi:MFS family permease
MVTNSVAVDSIEQDDEPATPAGGRLSLRYSYYVLAVLSAITVLNYYDRNVISIILQPMKLALHLSDTEAGLLSGVAFAAVYSLLGVPIARFADRGNRVRVLGAALTIWSIMTAACGFASSALGLFAARMGVGLGEAGGLPSTHALVADYFPAERRSSALSTIAIAGSLGVIMGLSVGGIVSDHFGWRAAFWVGGAPGLLFALIALLTIREPSRRLAQTEAAVQARAPQVPFGLALKTLARRPAFVFTILGMTISSIAAFGQQAWGPTFLIRAYAMRAGQIGVIYGLLSAVPAIIGMLVGGLVVDRWVRKDKRALVWILILTYGLAIPFGLVVYLTTNLKVALATTFVHALFSSIYVGPNYALIQGLAGHKLRATAAAIYMAVINLVGLSAGPAVVGFLSDRLVPVAGANSLRWSLCILLLAYVACIPVFFLAARTVRADLADAEAS